MDLLLVDLAARVVAQRRPGAAEPVAGGLVAEARSQALISASGSSGVSARRRRRWAERVWSEAEFRECAESRRPRQQLKDPNQG